jgi:signal transduction histidine kinase
VWLFTEYRSRKWKAENQTLEAKVVERTAEVMAQKEALQETLEHLQAAQHQLVQQEKLASLGELTAGIAHEIQNPLNFVNNFSEVTEELSDELQQELQAGHTQNASAIATDIKQNLQKIRHHGQRADAIVKNMLQHSRASTGQKEPTDINALADEYLRLAYHGLRAKNKSFSANLITEYDNGFGLVEVIPRDLGRVFLNLYNNAFFAVQSKAMQGLPGYVPTVSVSTLRHVRQVEIRVRDNGIGIPDSIKQKIFQPFFTTKPTGEGTGLGLSMSYDIITKGHGGTLKVETKEGEYSTFIVLLPLFLKKKEQNSDLITEAI